MIRDEGDLVRIIDRRIERALSEQRGGALKSKIDPAYTSGNPKTARAEDGSTAVGVTKKVLYAAGVKPLTASMDAIEILLPGGSAVGYLGDAPTLQNNYYQILPYEFPDTTTTVGIASNNQVRAFRFTSRGSWLFSKLSFEIATSGGVGSHEGVAIYSGDGTTRLATTGARNGQTDFGVINADLTDFVIEMGNTYWLGWTADDNTILWRAAALEANVYGILQGSVTHLGTSSNSSSGGAPPTSLGTISAAQFAVPIVKLQA